MVEYKPLPLRSVLAYAVPGPFIAFYAILFATRVPAYLSDTLRVPTFALGTIILLSRALALVWEPAVGALSDRTRFRLGRRIPWMVSAAPIVAVSFFFLLSPPAQFTSSALIVWIGGWTFAFTLAWTMFAIPYEALGAELVRGRPARNGFFAVRDGGILVGTLLTAVIPLVFHTASERELLRSMASTAGVTFLVGLTLTFVGLRSADRGPAVATESLSLRSAFEPAKNNRPYRTFLMTMGVGAVGAVLPPALLVYFLRHVVGVDQPEWYFLLLLVGGLVTLPAWMAAANRWEKKRVWSLGMVTQAAGYAGMLFVHEGELVLFTFFMALSAVGFGGVASLPSSMLADIVEYDERRSATRREGTLVGFSSFVRRCAWSLSLGGAFLVLHLAGYSNTSPQSGAVVTTLKVLFGGVPALCNILAVLVFSSYSLEEARGYA